MFSLRKWLANDSQAEWNQAITDPVLGELRLADEGDWWEATVQIGDSEIQFCIGGSGVPDANLILHTHNIIRNFSWFQHKLAEHLSLESMKRKTWMEEIQQLQLESIQLFWPARPSNAEISFKGPDPYRLWHCSYADGQFVGLGFDD